MPAQAAGNDLAHAPAWVATCVDHLDYRPNHQWDERLIERLASAPSSAWSGTITGAEYDSIASSKYVEVAHERSRRADV